MKKKYWVGLIAGVLMITVVGLSVFCFSMVPQMFRMNAQLKSEGYYMGEFEFKMLGILYYLDKGNFVTALNKFYHLHKQLETRQGLIKIPQLKNDKEKLNFYLSLQNPRNGAFMDDSYPLFTYFDPTANMIEVIDGLCKKTGQPVKLKYPLRFMEQINTKDKLTAYLDDLSTISSFLAVFPATPYVAGVSQLAYYDVYEGAGLYHFSPEWKETLVKWFTNNQDPKSGYWGVKIQGVFGDERHKDLASTFHIRHAFISKYGTDINPKYPMQYKDQMFKTTLVSLSQPMPADANVDELHDWSFTRSQGLELLAELWKGASPESKSQAKKVMKELVLNRYKAFYKKQEGGFSLYPDSKHADLDGTGSGIGLIINVGGIPGERQQLLWGAEIRSAKACGEISLPIDSTNLDLLPLNNVNSLRFYITPPNLNQSTKDNVLIYYPKEPIVLDIVDLKHRVASFLRNTNQSYGNWVSKEHIAADLDLHNLGKKPEIVVGELSASKLKTLARSGNKLYVIGFDELQIPQYNATLTVN